MCIWMWMFVEKMFACVQWRRRICTSWSCLPTAARTELLSSSSASLLTVMQEIQRCLLNVLMHRWKYLDIKHTLRIFRLLHKRSVADIPHQHRLSSASTEQNSMTFHCRSTAGGSAFPVAGAKVWNSLPADVTSASSLPVFKNRLKSYLFHHCYGILM